MLNFLNLMFAGEDTTTKQPIDWLWVRDIQDAIQAILWPILIVVGAAGMIYAVILGVNMARADSTEKREEAKKRLINVIVGIAITIALIFFFQLLVADNGILAQIFPEMKRTVAA